LTYPTRKMPTFAESGNSKAKPGAPLLPFFGRQPELNGAPRFSPAPFFFGPRVTGAASLLTDQIGVLSSLGRATNRNSIWAPARHEIILLRKMPVALDADQTLAALVSRRISRRDTHEVIIEATCRKFGK
jgi:hypothetical protein